LCHSIASLLQVKKLNCQEYGVTHAHIAGSMHIEVAASSVGDYTCVWTQNNYPESMSRQILTEDNIIIYEANAMIPFGWFMNGVRLFTQRNSEGHLHNYKPICLDIDGWKKGEAPFQYNVQVDGRIQASLRAREWLDRSIQEKD